MSIQDPQPTHAGGWRLERSYARLPAVLHARVDPVPVRQPRWVLFNAPLATELGLDAGALRSPAGAELLAGNALLPGSEPIAQAYAGHQFGHFTILGDGRALLLGEQIAPGGARFDVQLKGSGRTPFSRQGDGRAALGPMLREYLVSEAMHALGIPTTRSLAVVATGEPVQRETALPGAVLTRVAASHIRVGTFEYAAAQRDPEVLRALADYTLERHDPELVGSSAPYRALLEAAAERQAELVAKWLHVGFIHGVMNTDNMALSGETIDYGPCAFLDAYDPDTVYSSIDHGGRYAYGNQPRIAHWNLARLAEALLPLLEADQDKAVETAGEVLAGFEARFQRHWFAGLRAKLGLVGEDPEDGALIRDLFRWMQATRADFTNTFRSLATVGAEQRLPFTDAAFGPWHARWMRRLARQPGTNAEAAARMRAHSPAVIPRNHKVEEALTAAGQGDLAPLERLLAVLAEPYGPTEPDPEFTAPPPASFHGYRTFCGT